MPDLTDLTGIGPKTASALEKAGITNFSQLIETYPRTYRAYTATTIHQLKVGSYVILQGQLTRPTNHRTSRLTTQTSTFKDKTGNITLRWFNLPYLVKSLKPQTFYQLMGKVEEFRGQLQIISPKLKSISPTTSHSDQLVPIYRQMGSLKPWIFRTKIKQVLDTTPPIKEILPTNIIKTYSLMDYDQAIRFIHNPPSRTVLEGAIHRLSFQELYFLQLNTLQEKHQTHKLKQPLFIKPLAITQFIASLPFKLTHSQTKAIEIIIKNIESPTPMNRLLAGEVGSGKTIIATISALATYTAGYRTLIMAPTLILANQLYQSISRYLTPLNLEVSLITANHKDNTQADIIIGTQALINAHFNKIGLTIIDEQHRFGVKQKKQLTSLATHTLMMTATPIPRSLAQTLFSQLDITHLTELPASRLPTKTFLIPETKRYDAYTWIKTKLNQNHQVFFVTPLIEQAEFNDTTALKSLQELKAKLTRIFSNYKLDIMHGKMNDKEKLQHMKDFRSGNTQILVATSMIEVGIDIPQANIIVIENAERFGLATLHQLRGRVGRGGGQGYCLLFSESQTQKSLQRLKYFIHHTDGSKLAMFDLQTRGPGELFGTTQSGFFNLKLASIYDRQLLKNTYSAAKLALK